MIKVIHIITGLHTGGAEMMLYKLLSRSTQSRFEHIVLTLMNKETGIGNDIEDLGVPVYDLGLSQGSISVLAIRRLLKIVHKVRPDVIQGWMYHGNLAASFGRMFSRQKVPVIWNVRHSMHGLKFEKGSTIVAIRISAVLSRSTHRIIYNSSRGAKQHERLGYCADHTIVIPNGFDCELYKPSVAARESLLRSLGVDDSNILIGSVGRFHKQKDHSNLLKAAGILARKYNNVRFVLIGRDVDGCNKEIVDLVSHNHISNKVYLLGERKDIPELTAGFDIATSSSRYGEGFPNVIGEAMSCGVPCVVTDVGDSAWVVGNTGKVVQPRDAESLARGWAELINEGRAGRAILGTKARQRVLDNFTLSKIVTQYETLYDQLFSEGSKKI